MDWRDMPSLSSLRAFSAVAECLSYSAAGRSLNVSHAAISQQMRTLEAFLGVRLVVREGRGVALTMEGRELARSLNDGFSTIRRAVDALSRADATRPVHVTMTPAFAVSWLMPRIAEFRHRHPDIELMLNPTAELVDFSPGGVDIAIRFGDGRWPGLESEPLLLTNFVIVAATSLVGTEPFPDPARIYEFPWLQEYGTNELALWLDRQGVVSKRNLNVLHLPGHMMLDGLMRGEGVTATARAFIEPEIQSGLLRVLFEDVRDGSGYHIVTQPGVQRASVKAFVGWLRGHKETLSVPAKGGDRPDF